MGEGLTDHRELVPIFFVAILGRMGERFNQAVGRNTSPSCAQPILCLSRVPRESRFPQIFHR